MKRIFEIMLLLFMVSSLAGCSNKKNNVAVDDHLTLTWYCRNYDSAIIDSYDNVAAYQEIQNKLGIDIDFIHYTQDEQFQTMLATGRYPDIMEANWNSFEGGCKNAVDNIIIKLNDYLSEHSVYLKKYLEDDNILQALTLYDGTIAYFPQLKEEGKINAYIGPMIRADWLRKLNLKEPETIDEFTEMLKAFRDNDPNGNGMADEIPFSIEKDGRFSSLSAAFGVFYNEIYADESGKLVFGSIQDGFFEFLKLMRQWYEEGLLDDEFLAQNRAVFERKIKDDKVGATIAYMSSQMPLYNSYSTKSNEPIEYKAIAWLRKNEKIYNPINITEQVSEVGTAISTQNQFPVESVKLLDYMYSDEASRLLNWGIENVTYTDVGGNLEFTEQILNNPSGLTPIVAITPYCLTMRGGAKIMLSEPYQQLNHLPYQTEAMSNWAIGDVYTKEKHFTFTPEDSKKINRIMKPIENYCNDMMIKFITGISSLEEFDSYVKTIEKMGIYDAISVMERYGL